MAIASGGFHGLASKFDGTVWAWGANGGGQLCIGDFIQRNTPIPIPALNGAVVVAGSSADTVVLRPDGTVWTAGANFVGQLGNASGASFSNSNVLVQVEQALSRSPRDLSATTTSPFCRNRSQSQ
jgi:alpha-tubulin suppressor-like RCC1 family protein